MKIKTTTGFKIRRLASCSRNVLPESTGWWKTFFSNSLRNLSKDSLEKEIFNSCILLKNLAIVHKEMPMSADFILEQLMEGSRLLRDTYADILSAYRSGRGKDAFTLLYERVPVKAAKNFSAILIKLDQINPAELIAHMASFEESFASERMTKGMKRAERKSFLITMMASASVFAILLNFIVVVVFMDTMSMLRELF